MKKVYVKADLKEGTKPGVDEQTGTVLKIAWSNGNLLEGEVTSTQASATVTRCGVDVTDEYAASAFNWVRDSGDAEADNAWNAAHAGMKSITCTATDLNGDVKISCTLTASSATYGSITVDDDMDASHTPADLDANDIFVIENGDLKVTTSRGNAYVLENGVLKAAGAKLNGSITAETKLFASQPENMVEFSYNHNKLRAQKKVTKTDGETEVAEYMFHGELLMYLHRGNNALHFCYDKQKRPIMVEMNESVYSYIHNLQGDIVGILDSAGNLVVEYGYDAWGNPVLVRTLTTAYEKLAELNPFRYRGYVYDEETELCWVLSRYYDSQLHRFISADDVTYLSANNSLKNAYAYCNLRPVKLKDPTGYIPEDAAEDLIRENAQYIIDAAEEFGVDAQILAGVIYTEQVLNVDWIDTCTDWLGSTGLVDTSVGIAQVKMSTAESVEEAGLMERIDAEVYGFVVISHHKLRYARLCDNETNIRYAAAYLKQLTDAWQPSYENVAKSPSILGTLYNIGVGNPHSNPEPNDFGNHVAKVYDKMKELLGIE